MSEIRKEEKVAKARELFLSGYNCAQAVFAAYAPETGMEEREALRLSSGFGGGMGGMRGVCGTLSGMFMALGALTGYDRAEDKEGKKRLYARERALATRFAEEFEALHCKELLKRSGIVAGSEPSDRTPDYYRTRPCVRYVEFAAGLLADELNQEEGKADA